MAVENNKDQNVAFERLKATGSLTYSQSGYAPCEVKWELTPEQIIDIVKKQSKAFIDDIDKVKLDINNRKGCIAAFVWVAKNSRHSCNNDLKSSNSAINRSMMRYSDDIKEFMSKFCYQNEKRVISADQGVPLVGIRVAIERFMRIEFDESGSQYASKYGAKNQGKAELTLTSIFDKGDDGRFGKLQCIVVSKKLKNRFSGYKPRPKKSFNAR